ncbi:retrovirus-related pol polyprotein from transposon TNT 1-94 [Tanacetum coccineum]
MAGLLFNKYKGDSVRVLLVQELGEMLQALGGGGGIRLQVKQGLLSVITVKAQEAGQSDDLDAYDSDYYDISSAKAVLMANLSSYNSDVLSEEKESLLQTFTVFKKESKEKENIYMDKEIDLEKRIKELDNIVDKVDQSAQMVHMLTKPQVFYDDTHKQAFVDEEETSILEELNKLFEDFGKHFVPQMQLSAEQAFWLPILNPNSELVVTQTPVEIEVLKELPKCSINKKYFDIQKKELFLDNYRPLEHIICQDVMNIVKNVAVVSAHVFPVNNNKCLVHDNLEIERLEQDNDHLFELLLSQDIVHICVNSLATRNNCREMQQSFIHEYNENLLLKAELANKKENMIEQKVFNEVDCFHINEWQAKLEAKDVSIAKLKKHIENLKGKNVIGKDSLPNNAKEHADTLREIVKHARALRPLDSDLDSTYAVTGTSVKINIEHIEGKHNTLADSLSRLVNLCFAECTGEMKELAAAALYSVEENLHKTIFTPEEPGALYKCYQLKANQTPIRMDKSDAWRLVTQDLELSAAILQRQSLGYGIEGKSKKHSHKPKAKDSIQEKLYLLHMDLCGPMRIQSINGRKYILVIVDDYSWFTWVKFLRSKDEVTEFMIKFLKMIQVRLSATVQNIRTDNGTKFFNQTLRAYYEDVEISHQTFVAVATAYFTQNRSLISRRHNKTPYELLRDKKLDLSYLHVFGSLCYLTNDCEDLGKLKPIADIGIFVDYDPAKKAYRIYNKRTRLIIKTIHVDFDELTVMAFKQFSSEPGPQLLTPETISSGLMQNPPSPTPYVPPTKKDWDIFF